VKSSVAIAAALPFAMDIEALKEQARPPKLLQAHSADRWSSGQRLRIGMAYVLVGTSSPALEWYFRLKILLPLSLLRFHRKLRALLYRLAHYTPL
jgi:hypothetical protein